MEILARAVGRRKEAVAQVQLVRGNGQFIINDKPAHAYLQNNSCSLICIKSPLEAALSVFSNQPDTAPSLQTEQSETINLTNVSSLASKPPTVVEKDLVATLADQKEEQKGFLGQQEQLPLTKSGEFVNVAEGVASPKGLDIDVIIKVKGGGLIGQAEAIKLGVARAFCIMENSEETSLRKVLKTKGYLTQDSRVKERRKYGLKKARKASQYHKR